MHIRVFKIKNGLQLGGRIDIHCGNWNSKHRRTISSRPADASAGCEANDYSRAIFRDDANAVVRLRQPDMVSFTHNSFSNIWLTLPLAFR